MSEADRSPIVIARRLSVDGGARRRHGWDWSRIAYATYGIVPVVELQDVTQAEDLFAALSEGGLPAAEITLRTPDAGDRSRATYRSASGRGARCGDGAKPRGRASSD